MGFMFTYLYTELIIAPLIAHTDKQFGDMPDRDNIATIDEVPSRSMMKHWCRASLAAAARRPAIRFRRCNSRPH